MSGNHKEVQMSKFEKLEKELTVERKSSWLKKDEAYRTKAFSFSEDYRKFLSDIKTERENVVEVAAMAEKKGFKKLSEMRPSDKTGKFYEINHDKNLVLIVLGRKPVAEGVNLVASHVDVPHIDFKMSPFYEDEDYCMVKTHYYGGIKKYQWVNMPLAVHGIVVKKDGTKVNILWGEDTDEGVLTFPDVLPHLSRKVQGDKKLLTGFTGEDLNMICGSIPVDDDKVKNKIKLNILSILNDKYGITEGDFVSAEMQLVPAGEARWIGFDKGLLGAFGHDDRICGYTSSQAIFDIEDPEYTAINFLADKEEIGSDGRTGMKSWFILRVIAEMIEKQEGAYDELKLKRALEVSNVLSSDVGAGINPNFKSVHDAQNAPRLGHGIVLTKYTGSGGKYSSNDADAEFVAKIRNLFDTNDVDWQIGTLGKVDEGGGGTVAKFLAEYNMNVVDAGPALLSMHSPFEIASVLDIYSCYEAYRAFFNDMR